jgi:hypothetical protein
LAYPPTTTQKGANGRREFHPPPPKQRNLKMRNPNGDKPNVVPGAGALAGKDHASASRANQMGRQHALLKALTQEETVKIAGAAKFALYDQHKKEGKPLPTTEEIARAANAALASTRERIVSKAEGGTA